LIPVITIINAMTFLKQQNQYLLWIIVFHNCKDFLR
jgi:hypothetical protein